MNQIQRRKAFLQKGLAVAVAGFMMSSVHAATEKDEIKQLREEVQALKALVQQQQQVQINQQAQLEQSRRAAVVVATPGQITAVAAPVKESPLASLKSKMGANVNLYGSVRADAEYQFKGGDGIFNRINAVDLNGVADANGVINPNKDRLYSTLTASRIGLDFVAPVQGADVGGKIELDFRGGDKADTVRIRHAYLTYNNWLIGQTTSSFLSLDTQPEMLDFGGVLGTGTFRTPMVRYGDKLSNTTSYVVGLEQGDSANRLPVATAKISQKFNGDQGLVTARALIQEARVRVSPVKDVNGKPLTSNEYNDQTEFGWGLAVGAKYKLNDQLSVSADYTHLKGDSTYLLYDKGMTYNTARAADDLQLIDQDAVSVGATYRFHPQWRSSLGYGAIFYDKQANNQNNQLQQGWVNVMYNPTKPVTLGLEYVYGEREQTVEAKDLKTGLVGVNDRTGRDSRIGVMAKYDF